MPGRGRWLAADSATVRIPLRAERASVQAFVHFPKHRIGIVPQRAGVDGNAPLRALRAAVGAALLDPLVTDTAAAKPIALQDFSPSFTATTREAEHRRRLAGRGSARL